MTQHTARNTALSLRERAGVRERRATPIVVENQP
jgi:hypothetical protein